MYSFIITTTASNNDCVFSRHGTAHQHGIIIARPPATVAPIINVSVKTGPKRVGLHLETGLKRVSLRLDCVYD